MNEQLSCAILGLVNTKPMSGYELKQFSQQTIAHFWQVNFSQIYPTLKKLLSEKYLEKKSTPVGKKNKYTYYITASGKEKLNKWLEKPHQKEDKKIPFLLKIFFSEKISKIFFYHLENYLLENEKKLKTLLTLEENLKKIWENQESEYQSSGLSETIDFGIYITKAKIKWIKKQFDLKNLI